MRAGKSSQPCNSTDAEGKPRDELKQLLLKSSQLETSPTGLFAGFRKHISPGRELGLTIARSRTNSIEATQGRVKGGVNFKPWSPSSDLLMLLIPKWVRALHMPSACSC